MKVVQNTILFCVFVLVASGGEFKIHYRENGQIDNVHFVWIGLFFAGYFLYDLIVMICSRFTSEKWTYLIAMFLSICTINPIGIIRASFDISKLPKRD